MITLDTTVKLLDVLRAYERWEADLILCREAWDTADGLPRFTQDLYDRFMEIQAMRNRVMLEVKGAKS